MKQDSRVAETDGQAWRSVCMGRATTFTAAATPDSAQFLDNISCTRFSIEVGFGMVDIL
jgi:hypothetical protein